MALSKFAITRGLMSGGMNERHKRREFLRYNCEVDKYNKQKVIEKDLVLSKSSDEKIIIDSLPKLKNLQLFLR